MGSNKRKLPYNEREENGNPNHMRGDRAFKQMRGGHHGMVHGYGPRDARLLGQNCFAAFPPATSAPFQIQLPTTSGAFPPHHSNHSSPFSMPPPTPNSPFAFDPNDPVAAMMAMQAMGGFAQLPGMPPFPLPPSPAGVPVSGQQHSKGRFPPRHRLKPPCKDYDTKGYCLLGDSCPYEHGTDHLVVPPKNDEYDPAKSNIMMDVQPSNGTNLNPNVSSNGRSNDRGHGRGRGGQSRGVPSRADFSMVGSNEDRSITTIVIEQIPEDNFTEDQVREFFSQFGTILEITMRPYKHLALVKYDNYFSARSAWKSPKPVFDNRFVKVYWYKPSSPEDDTASGVKSESSSTGIKSELGFNAEGFARQQALAQEAHEEKAKKRQETENARHALKKQKEELLKRQEEEKAKLMVKLAAKAGNSKPNTNWTGTGLEPSTNGSHSTEKKDNDRTQALRDQLAALEAEARTLGIDPEAAEEPIPYYTRGRGRGRGRGSYRGRGGYPSLGGYGNDTSYRGGYRGGHGGGRGRSATGPSVMRLDNRPKTVSISGVEFDDAKGESLREYLFVSFSPIPFPVSYSSSFTATWSLQLHCTH
jgi:RNA recognition motif-containing protein